jgi:tetratricopeptide (TPR) repeat protein
VTAGLEPYVGLRAYDAADADRFFGRSHEAREILTRWRSNRLLVLHGSSGIGKTSLLQAGVLPRINPRDADVLPVGRLARGSALPAEASHGQNPYTFALLSSWSARRPLTQWRGRSIAEFFADRPERVDDYGDPVPVFAAIDRFEDLFSDFPQRWAYCVPFLRELAVAAAESPQLRLLLCVRDDHLADLDQYLAELDEIEVAPYSRDRFRLLALAPDAALEAVSKPMALVGRTFLPGVAEELVTRLRTIPVRSRHGLPATTVLADRVEPVPLQVVCGALWREVPPGAAEITADHLRDYGDVGRVLADFYHQVVAEVSVSHGIDEPMLRRWLARTFVTELGTRGMSYEGASSTSGMPNEVVRALAERHLLRVERRLGARWYELAHERLVEPVVVADPGGDEGDAEAPGAAESNLRAAEMALDTGDVELAGKYAREAVRLAGTSVSRNSGEQLRTLAEAETFLGNLARQQNKPVDAEARYRQAAIYFEMLGYPSAVGRLQADIGGLLVAQGKIASALEELLSAVNRLHGDLSVRVALAHAYAAAGQLNAALSVYNDVLDADPTYAEALPTHAEALSGRGQLRVDLGEGEEALRDLDRLFDLHPEHRSSLGPRSARVLALVRVGRAEEVAAEIVAILADAAGHGPAQLRIAQALRATDGLVLAAAAEPAQLLRQALDADEPALLPYQRAAAQRLLAEIDNAAG